MIESDRFGLMGNAKDLILKDLEKLLGEYFLLCGKISLEIEGEENDFTVTVSLRAGGVKRFNVLN